MEDLEDTFRYVYSCDVQERITIKIGTLEGVNHKPDYEKLLANPMLKFSGLYQAKEGQLAELKIILQVWDENRPVSLKKTSSHKAFTTRYNFNEWITLPIAFCDISRTAQITITVYDCIGPGQEGAIGGTTISIFGKHGVFRQGMLDLKVWPNREADGNNPTQTPGKTKGNGTEQMPRLAKLVKLHRNGHIPKIDWLDRLVFREIEVINEREKRNSDFMYLTVEFPEVVVDNVPHHIVYYEPCGDDVYQFRTHGDLVTVPDCEIGLENLVEAKYHKLARSVRSGGNDRDTKPNSEDRDMLNVIVAYPATVQLSNEDQDLVWKFRYFLSNQKKALTKFLKCVNWKQSNEVRQALSMLQSWAPMDVEDALELLSPNFTHPAVRRYAVSRLKQAPDEDLLLYLLQLVQALKYENFDEINAGFLKIKPHLDDNAENNNKKDVDMMESGSDGLAEAMNVMDLNNPPNDNKMTDSHPNLSEHGSANTAETLLGNKNGEDDNCDLASFLIQRACQNLTLCNYFYWYLLIECEDQQESAAAKQDGKVKEMYLTVMNTFSQTLAKGNQEFQQRRAILTKQQIFIDKLVSLVKTVSRERGDRKKKADRLQQLLADTETFKFNFVNFEPMPFPLDPDVIIKGIIPDKASLFKSALMPSRLTFLTTDNKEYVAIFKHGDDLRQDQLILQMITLMDKLLRMENLDLKLTPYRVLATSTKHGFLQYIDSKTVAEVLNTEGSIQNFFRKHHPSETGPYGIASEVMDTYVRSVAGYCVITYLLGVGDRHLDNLLLTDSGKLFHIDFGYILGRDPKPLPPPMKLSKEMVEAMGGPQSEHYQEFRKQCYTAFLHLRRHANLMLNLFSLMVDASVPDIALEPDKAVRKVQDKLRLDLGDEEAILYLQSLLDMSVTAVMAVLVEHIHKFAQYWRK